MSASTAPPTSSYEVPEPIQNSPFAEPSKHWYIREGETPELRAGRRAAVVFPPRDQKEPWKLADGTLAPSKEYPTGFDLALVNLIREHVKAWRAEGYPGATRTTLELLNWWTRDGREKRLFFAQVEAAETIIFLVEARADFRQGVEVPRDDPSEERKLEGYKGFTRRACKMATGSGKTMVMGMVAAWSILNKVNDRSDGRFSDVVLIVCPNVTIRSRLGELDPEEGEASLYRTRDLVPSHLMPLLTQGRVLVTNWHVFEPHGMQTGGVSAKVTRAGKAVRIQETITIGAKTTTARGNRYLTPDDLARQVAAGMLTILDEEKAKDGTLKRVKVEAVRYVESDTALVARILGREVGGKQNILVMNDEAHHAYRIRREEREEDEEESFGEEEEAEDFFKEATVWIDGLDRIDKLRGINFCVDLSATPYFLGRVGQDTNKPFPWVVSDFGLIDAIESGLVKIPQLAVRDTTAAAIPGYFNIWHWILPQLTPAERGGKRANPKPEAILKYAHTPIAMLGSLWEKDCENWAREGTDPRRPVFILVCKTTQLARVIYEWLGEGKPPSGIPPIKIEAFRNQGGKINTIRVDSKVVHETDTEGAKSDESRWMRLTLDTVGKQRWPSDRQGRPIYPEGFEDLVKKLGHGLEPPGRDVRCIVSVGMLTRDFVGQAHCTVPAHVLFPQLRAIIERYVREKVHVRRPADVKDLFLAPYYGWLVERLLEAIRPDTSQGEAPEVPRYETSRGPGSTEEVDLWTSRDVREVVHSHLNYVVADTKQWEQSAAYVLDKHPAVHAFVKNAGLGFAISYLHNGQMHDYVPDFIVRLKGSQERHLILETKGYDPLEEVKRGAAERWVRALNADGTYGLWSYAIAKRVSEIGSLVDEAAGRSASP